MHPLFAGLPVALVCMLFGAFADAGPGGRTPGERLFRLSGQ
jgi:hypothetical protein